MEEHWQGEGGKWSDKIAHFDISCCISHLHFFLIWFQESSHAQTPFSQFTQIHIPWLHVHYSRLCCYPQLLIFAFPFEALLNHRAIVVHGDDDIIEYANLTIRNHVGIYWRHIAHGYVRLAGRSWATDSFHCMPHPYIHFLPLSILKVTVGTANTSLKRPARHLVNYQPTW